MTARTRELGIVLALALLLAVTAANNPGFLGAQSLQDLLLGATILVVLAVGQTLVVITRNVDLSVGSIVGLVAFATGKLFIAHPGLPILLAVLAGAGLGAACGALNGGLVAAARVPARVITLGTLYVFRGIDFGRAAGQQINAADMPAGFLRLGTRTLLGVPVLAVVALLVLVVAGWCLRSYRSGRDLYAIGSQPAAARLSGIKVGQRVFATCHSRRLLGIGDRPERLLRAVRGLTLPALPGEDQCCGFGGTFAVKNAATSVAMGQDKTAAVRATAASVLTSADTSCLLHIGGLLSREGAAPRVMHMAEILASTEPVPSDPVSSGPVSSDPMSS